MSKVNLEQLKEAYQKLPEDVKAAYSSDDTTTKIQNIGKKYNLHLDKLGELVDEVGLVMVGLVPVKQLSGEILTRLKIDQPLAEQITADINQQIFLPIRESLEKMSAPPRPPENLPTADEVLKAVENPPPAPPTPNIFEQKMSQMFNLPRETSAAPEAKKVDPYVEPI